MNLQPGVRPVPNSPDYQLIRKLGAGAFGEVWHAHGPGGVDVALKFIHLASHVREAELRSLDAVKGIRHPNLVSLFGTWQKDNWLILAMEKCDRSLQDRLAEALGQNLPGIPLKELLSYMTDAANGLDAMNAKQVQHRDVKPANLLLVSSGVKVADFGLAKAMEQTVVSNSGAGTLAFTAPECFDGKLTQQTDQYSLAVTYYFLRTGQLLFKGDQAKVMYAHLAIEPDLTELPDSEARILGRALSKKPEKRWRSCKAFVDELIAVQLCGNLGTIPALDAARSYFRQGLLAQHARNCDNAIAAFNNSIRLDPTFALAYFQRGFCWFEKREYEDAIADFNEAIRLNPDMSFAYSIRGDILKEYERAIEDFGQTIRHNPNHAAGFRYRGEAKLANDDNEGAIKDFSEAIRLDPEICSAYVNRAVARIKRQEFELAIVDFNEAIQIDPNHGSAHERLAWVLGTCPEERFRDGYRAVQLGIRACDLTNWRCGFALNTLAAAYAEAAQFENAIRYQTCATDDPVYWKFAEAAVPHLLEQYKLKRNPHVKKLGKIIR